MAKLRMAHASTHGARKPPGPTSIRVKTYYQFIIYTLPHNADYVHLHLLLLPVVGGIPLVRDGGVVHTPGVEPLELPANNNITGQFMYLTSTSIVFIWSQMFYKMYESTHVLRLIYV